MQQDCNLKMAEEYFANFELEDITVDDLKITNYESTELIISDIIPDEEIGLIYNCEESLLLESIPTKAGEVEIAFVEEPIIKKTTVQDESKAAESSKRKKYQC